jgi:signal transduction histidine kinase
VAALDSEVEQGRRTLEFLSHLSRAFAEAGFDLERLCATAAESVAEWLGDTCGVRLISEDGGQLEPTAVHHRVPEGAAVFREIVASQSVRDGLSGEVIRSGRNVRIDAVDPVALRRSYQSPMVRAYLERVPVRCILIVPVKSGGAVIGTVAVNRTEDRPYTRAEEALLEEVADRLSLEVRAARQYLELQAERRSLASGREQLQIITDTLPVLVAYLGPDLHYRFTNLNYAHWFGDAGRSAVGRHCRELLGPAAYERARPHLERALSGIPVSFESEMPDGDGASRFVRGSYIPHCNASGAVEGIVVLLTDITDERQAAAENLRLFQEAQVAVAVRDEFMSIAGHELRTPLTALKLRIELLAEQVRQGRPGDRIAAHTERAQRELARLASLVDQLLDISRIHGGRLRLERTRVSLAEVVQEVVARAADEFARAGCTVELALDASVAGDWDRLRIEQIVGNLISNALKYGKGQPVQVRVERVDAQARIVVADRGIGISAADQVRIFQRFERAVPSHHFGGSGLGLWIVRQLVEAHGGAIHVASAPDQGATFIVDLPTEAVDAAGST